LHTDRVISEAQLSKEAIRTVSPTGEIVANLRSTERFTQLRRSTLVFLRWVAAFAQIIALYAVTYLLDTNLPVLEMALIVGVSLIVNIGITFAWPLDRQVTVGEATSQLGFDVLQLSALLYYTGGMSNPFAMLLMAPVVTAAITLSLRTMALLTLMVGISGGLLIFYHMPLPWVRLTGFETPLNYRIGMWVAVMFGSIFTALYSWRSAAESRRMSVALTATERVLAREQRISAIGGLAAAAAHELGTPLATIQVVAKELARGADPETPMGQDAALLLEQSRRCRDILTKLSYRGDAGDMMHNRFTLRELISEVIEPFIGSNKTFVIDVKGPETFEPSNFDPNITIARRAELLYGIRNFVENAVSFAAEEILITTFVTKTDLTIIISDDGPGFDPLIRDRLGEPYVTSRPDRNKKVGYAAGGLGLGLFIAKTLIRRTGGRVRFETAMSGGAEVRMNWPLSALRASPSADDQQLSGQSKGVL